MVTEERIVSVLADLHEPARSVRRSRSIANENGGEDNVTVIVVRYLADKTP